MFRSLTRTQMTVDITVAAVFFVVMTGLTVMSGSTIFASRGHLVLAGVLSAVFSAALALRRWAPGIALGVAWIAAVIQMSFGLPPMPADLAILGILYGAAAYGTRLVYWLSFVSSLGGAIVITLYLIVPTMLARGVDLGVETATLALLGVTIFVAAALALLLGWTAGALARSALRARANRRGQELAEAEAAAEAERARIARDMHDVVAHSLAVVIAQADGARYAAATDPQAASAALGTIGTTARAALSDVRMLLTQLRHTQADGPQPTLADLEQLYAQVRAAGVDLSVDVDPAPRGEAPASIQLAVYRILQEALTNALRHGERGAGGAVDVTLAWHDDRVEMTVRNPVAPAGDEASDHTATRGHGLIGMRERAQLVGGTIDAAPDGAGAFVVSASLPIGATA